MFCLDLMVQVLLLNIDQSLSGSDENPSVWKLAMTHLLSLVKLPAEDSGSTGVANLTSRAVTQVLGSCVTLLETNLETRERTDAMHGMAMLSLQELLAQISAASGNSQANRALRENSAPRLAYICTRLYLQRPELMRESDLGRSVLLSFMRIVGPTQLGSGLGLCLLRRVLACVLHPRESSISPKSPQGSWDPMEAIPVSVARDNFPVWFSAIMCFSHTDPDLEDHSYARALNRVRVRALELLFEFYTRVPAIWIDTTTPTQWEEAWERGWYPILEQLSLLCRDKRHRVRNQAMSFLQRALLAQPDIISGPAQVDFVVCCLDRVVFPLLDELIGADSARRGTGRGTLEETRVRAFALLSKIFLHHLPLLQQHGSFAAIFLRVLSSAQKYVACAASSKSEVLAESVPESLKNMLLVMAEPAESQSGSGFSPGTELWEQSWTVIDQVNPRLRSEFGQLLGSSAKPSDPSPVSPNAAVQSEVPPTELKPEAVAPSAADHAADV